MERAEDCSQDSMALTCGPFTAETWTQKDAPSLTCEALQYTQGNNQEKR